MPKDLPSPILLFGDEYLCKNNIRDAKKKYRDYSWEVISLKESSPEAVRFQASFLGFGVDKKIILVQDLPNNKETREFLIRISTETKDGITLLIWDSENNIKVDPKTKTLGKLWGDFVNRIRELPNSKVINNGEAFTEKQDKDCFVYVRELFDKKGKEITGDAVAMMISMVGRDKGLLLTEVDKLSLAAPTKITLPYVLENVYPSSKEAILYKFGNILDNCSYGQSIAMMEHFLETGVNPNVLVEVMAKKARWQLAAVDLWHKGLSWSEVKSKMVEMGKFPSSVWHNNNLTFSQKKKASEEFDSIEKMVGYFSTEKGLPSHYFKKVEKKRNTECLPLPFMADQIVDFIQEQIVKPNRSIPEKDLKEKVLDRGVRTYLKVINGLKQIRYDIKDLSQLNEMVAALVDRRLI